MELLGNISTIHWLILLTISLAGGFLGALSYLRILYRKEKLILDNLKRPIKVFFPQMSNGDDMEMEYNLLSRSGLFNVERPTSDVRDMVGVQNHSLIILGCNKKMKNFDAVFDGAAQKKIPVVIYTFGNNEALTPGHWKKLKTYPYYSVCNTPLRLVSDVFTLISTFPNKI